MIEAQTTSKAIVSQARFASCSVPPAILPLFHQGQSEDERRETSDNVVFERTFRQFQPRGIKTAYRQHDLLCISMAHLLRHSAIDRSMSSKSVAKSEATFHLHSARERDRAQADQTTIVGRTNKQLTTSFRSETEAQSGASYR